MNPLRPCGYNFTSKNTHLNATPTVQNLATTLSRDSYDARQQRRLSLPTDTPGLVGIQTPGKNSSISRTSSTQLPQSARQMACDLLRHRLAEMEGNPVLKRELQELFIYEVATVVDTDTQSLEDCFERSFDKFKETRSGFHWRILADVFKSTYVTEAGKALREVEEA